MGFLISITLVFLLWIDPTFGQGSDLYEIREHTLTSPYPSIFAAHHSFWQTTGNTLVTDRFIRLTPDTQSRAGGLWSTVPVSYPDWEIHVHFKIHGHGTTLFGDGFVFWYVKDPKETGPVFGYKDKFHGLAIVMDTYANKYDGYYSVFPHISAIVNNGTLHYSHDVDGLDISIAGCESNLRGRDFDTLIAIRYQNNILTVSTDVDGLNNWQECFSVANVRLPTYYYFGFSAETGQLSDNHDIISVRTFRLDSNETRLTEDRRDIIPSGPLNQTESYDVAPPPTRWPPLKIFFIASACILFLFLGIGTFYFLKTRRQYKARLY